ncbi:MAG: sigma-70 family RNA polymerase sigma factor [Phycisphaerales bacterium]|nr:MAG: sigma-70 family RNA polymerase sigma factor [Phycisphaerales bacterium]
MDWVTTSTILERLHDFDDRSVWETFSRRFRRPLIAFARKVGVPDGEVDDVVQEILLAFIDAFRRDQYDRQKGRLSHWLFGIAYRQIANARRKRAIEAGRKDPRGEKSSFWGGVPDEREAQATWDEEWEKSLIETCLRQARSEVSESTYRAFEMVVRQGRTPDEAAAELKMTRNAVYVAKHRVLKRLEELMKDYEDLLPDR